MSVAGIEPPGSCSLPSTIRRGYRIARLLQFAKYPRITNIPEFGELENSGFQIGWDLRHRPIERSGSGRCLT